MFISLSTDGTVPCADSLLKKNERFKYKIHTSCNGRLNQVSDTIIKPIRVLDKSEIDVITTSVFTYTCYSN